MRTRELERKFRTIVDTLVSTKDVDPQILQAHVREYAKAADVSYTLARRAVIWKAQHILNQRVAKLY